MSNPTPAQEEFANLIKNSAREAADHIHPEDRDDYRRDLRHQNQDISEEDEFLNSQIDVAMRMPTLNNYQAGSELRLPPASFDSGRSTGVKGVIADARSFENARRKTWRSAVRTARYSVFGGNQQAKSESETDGEGSGSELADEEAFVQQWRESRRRELETEAARGIRNRRTSPSVRLYGRFDEVDALGYLDAIEKVGRETVVVVFVCDPECEVSVEIERALVPLVSRHPSAHFVKVHYDEIEFDNAAVPAILAYRNQGDLFANLTGIIEMIPENEPFSSESLVQLFQKHDII